MVIRDLRSLNGVFLDNHDNPRFLCGAAGTDAVKLQRLQVALAFYGAVAADEEVALAEDAVPGKTTQRPRTTTPISPMPAKK